MGNGDLAKILYWSCVLWPLVSIIGIAACHDPDAKIRCNLLVSLVLVMITVASCFITDDFYLSLVWNHDALTRFLRVMIAIGLVQVLLTLKFSKLSPLHLTSYSIENQQKLFFNLSILHLFVGASMLAVGINNLFIAMLVLFVSVFLLMMACFLNGGNERVISGWNYFRYILLFMLIVLMGVFILALPLAKTNLLVNRFGSFMIAFGVILAVGVFPVFIPFLRMVAMLPVLLGGVACFLVPLDFLTLFVRLHQIPDYQTPRFLLLALVALSLGTILLKEKETPFLLSAHLLVSLTALAGIFADQAEGIYSVCLLIMTLVFFVPIGYVLRESRYHDDFKEWFILVFSAFPPFGIFFACFILVSYLMTVMPMAAYMLLGFFFVRGYFLFHKKRLGLCSRKELMREGWYFMTMLVLPTLIMPVLATCWLSQIARQFVQN